MVKYMELGWSGYSTPPEYSPWDATFKDQAKSRRFGLVDQTYLSLRYSLFIEF